MISNNVKSAFEVESQE